MPDAREGFVSIPDVRAVSYGLALICEVSDGRRFAVPRDFIGPESQVRAPGDFGRIDVLQSFASQLQLV